jgi:hypothetical protein
MKSQNALSQCGNSSLGKPKHSSRHDVAGNLSTCSSAIIDCTTGHESKDSLGFQDQPEREPSVLAATECLHNILSKKAVLHACLTD